MNAVKILAGAAVFLGLLVIGGAASHVHARGGCGQLFRQQQQFVHHAAVIAQPVVLYQAGVHVEQDALAERIAQRVEARIIQRLQAGPAAQAQTAPPQEQAPTAMAVHCGKCHSGPNPKGGITFDGVTPLECFHITKALRAIASEKMPKDHRLTPEQKGEIMQALLDLEHQDPVPVAPSPAPPEEQLK